MVPVSWLWTCSGLPARSSKWGETSLGLRGSLLSSAPSSHAPSTLLSRAKHEHADGAHEGGVSDKQPPVPSIGLVSSPLKLSALDPPSAALAQSLPKPDFKIPRSGVDKKVCRDDTTFTCHQYHDLDAPLVSRCPLYGVSFCAHP